MLFATALVAAAAMNPNAEARPVTLEAIPYEGGVALKLVGAAQAATQVSYTLEIEAASGNRSRQSGQASLHPGRPAILLDLRVSTGGRWRAQLTVTPAGAEPYHQTLASGDQAS